MEQVCPATTTAYRRSVTALERHHRTDADHVVVQPSISAPLQPATTGIDAPIRAVEAEAEPAEAHCHVTLGVLVQEPVEVVGLHPDPALDLARITPEGL